MTFEVEVEVETSALTFHYHSPWFTGGQCFPGSVVFLDLVTNKPYFYFSQLPFESQFSHELCPL